MNTAKAFAAQASTSRHLGRALTLAGSGFVVFPCREQNFIDSKTGEVYKAKTPYTPHGFKVISIS